MPNNATTPEPRSDRAWGFLMGWIGRVTAIVGLCATIAGGVTWLVTHQRQHRERTAQLALAQTQTAQGDYSAAVGTYADLLKSNPLDRDASDSQLNTTMLWAENFSVLVPEGQSATQAAGGALDEIMSILESGLTRSKGTRVADVQAHLGWAHWLNQHIAAREFGPAAGAESSAPRWPQIRATFMPTQCWVTGCFRTEAAFPGRSSTSTPLSGQVKSVRLCDASRSAVLSALMGPAFAPSSEGG